jgi:hypothetical protein
MVYLPPSGLIPAPDGVPGMTIVVGTSLLEALGLAVALCLGAMVVVMLAGRQSWGRGAGRSPSIAPLARGVPADRRAAGGAR